MSAYPDGVRARNAWVVARRGPKASLDPFVPYGILREEEIDALGRLLPSVVVLITNRECPLRCVFCDLWQNTLDARVPKGAIAAQVRSALARVPGALLAKLYNAGSFFDPNAIPVDEYGEIADALGPVEHVVVESHPSFVGERALRFRDVMGARTLEVAIGLETVEPGVLERLNKGMTVRSFERAAAFLEREGIGLRVFVMLQPPFSSVRESVVPALVSVESRSSSSNTIVRMP